MGLAALALGALAFSSSSKPATGAGSGESQAKRAADAIATRDPNVMRKVADEMEREGARELAEGLRMAADLAIGQREANP